MEFKYTLKTRPNIALIGEEVEQKKTKFKRYSKLHCFIIKVRADKGKNLDTALIQEGFIEFIPTIRNLYKN